MVCMCHINTVVECGPPPNITNGQVDYAGITYWSTANYSCDIGYRLAGSEVKICQDSKMWTPNDTACNSETMHTHDNTRLHVDLIIATIQLCSC